MTLLYVRCGKEAWSLVWDRKYTRTFCIIKKLFTTVSPFCNVLAWQNIFLPNPLSVLPDHRSRPHYGKWSVEKGRQKKAKTSNKGNERNKKGGKRQRKRRLKTTWGFPETNSWSRGPELLLHLIGLFAHFSLQYAVNISWVPLCIQTITLYIFIYAQSSHQLDYSLLIFKYHHHAVYRWR